ncbi:uncharacterized protein LOC6050270 [Culex quinquefasciatus]|uniref:uncharacterized protein LOC6050270 n=1 Tax=Culex quinquefasciatus TaxID=7176 RepID=UPI0018E2D62A|nr:uncharacterized protein LOC6050270 [Culex quinquefasciatus]XP_038121069.1 uncharacterized protein LOC6050270 [Culex quinquefasciatus]
MTFGSREFSKEAKSAIAVMRSLIISEKGTSSLFRILGDFRKEEGHPLMYKDFGYRSAAEFLEATGEFILREQNGEVVVFVKPSEESSHIQKMIAAQKTTKKPAKKPAFAMTWNKTPYQTNRYPGGQNKFQAYPQQSKPQYYQQQSKPYYSYQQQPAKTSFSGATAYSQQQSAKPSYQPQQQPAKTSFLGFNQQQSKPATTLYQQQSAKPSYQPQQHQQQKQSKPASSYQQQQRFKNPNNPLSSFFGNGYGSKAATGTQSQSVVPPKPAPTPKVAPPPAETPARPVNSTNPFHQAQTNPFVKPEQPAPAASAPVKMDTAPPAASPKPVQPQVATPSPQVIDEQKMDTTENDAVPVVRAIRQSFKAPTTVPPQVFTPESIAQVVQVQQQNLIRQQQEVTPSVEKVLQKIPLSSTKRATFKWDQPGATPEELLFQYGQSYGCPPIYKIFEVKQRFHCKVTINGTVYRTYPTDYATELESKSAVARCAIEAIRRSESRQFRECDDTDDAIAAKIYDLLLPCQYGMQLDNVPKAFRDSHGSLLPKHWKLIVQANLTRLFKTEEIPNHSVIVFAARTEKTPLSPQAQRMSANVLELPWSEDEWDLFVTHPVSLGEIWARLVGAEYSDKMGEMLTEIEKTMECAQRCPKASVTAGEYYLVPMNDSWFRVRVDALEPTGNTVTVFFVDLGGTCSIPMNQIYACEPRFLELPGQAICFALHGLQDLGDSPFVESYLQDNVSGKVLIGQVHTRREQYEAVNDDMTGYGDVPISITLFDTTTETVNINEDLMKGIRNESPER